MRLFEVYQNISLTEESTDAIQEFQRALSQKIKELPQDGATLRALREIEELLDSVAAGGRAAYVNQQLDAIDDPEVKKFKNTIARVILSLDADPEDRKKMLDLWRQDDGLVDTKKLTQKGRFFRFPELIKDYTTNPAVREFADELMSHSSQGVGKGEMALGVLSRQINLPPKGDLEIKGMGVVEVKTFHRDGGRFSDRDVIPNDSYAQFKMSVIEKVLTVNQSPFTRGGKKIDLETLIDAAQKIQNSDDQSLVQEFRKDIQGLIRSIFTHLDGARTNDIAGGILKGDLSRNDYGLAAFDNYMSAKKDNKGVLFLRIDTSPYTSFYVENSQDFNAPGVSIVSKSFYPISDALTEVYPKLYPI